MTSTEFIESCRQAYTLRLDHVSQSTSVYQCVFILVRKDEEVLRTAAAAQRAFGEGDGTGYMPHLSLIYADISQEERAKLVNTFQVHVLAALGLRWQDPCAA